MQDHKSVLTQTVDKIITQKIEETDCNIKPINKLLIQEIRTGFKAYIEKLDEQYDSESDFNFIYIPKPTVKNPVATNNIIGYPSVTM
ncbi:6193_t:CDS:2 [Diversispora eburnea]|uniref:6193_t:CDS:1 n=1 Tax=Diversispora eburnea TaxID=1213867 RepID=A0A9N8ZNA3_9GLOM|nr:6193_t:CDS:2 [Diversispora eburnea]